MRTPSEGIACRALSAKQCLVWRTDLPRARTQPDYINSLVIPLIGRKGFLMERHQRILPAIIVSQAMAEMAGC